MPVADGPRGLTSRVHVVAGVLVNERREVLVARRPPGGHLAGLWEFPGGKLESGEAPRAGLERELWEELGIRVLAARPFIQVEHDYPDRSVLLDVWRVRRWRGAPRGREGQPLAWVSPAALEEMSFPPADDPVIAALRECVGLQDPCAPATHSAPQRSRY